MALIALMTANTATNGLYADPKFFRFNAFFMEDIGDDIKSRMGTAIFMR